MHSPRHPADLLPASLLSSVSMPPTQPQDTSPECSRTMTARSDALPGPLAHPAHHPATVAPPGRREAILRELWGHMTAIYGHRWTSAYGADAATGAGQVWGEGMMGLTPRQIRAGAAACRDGRGPADGWPPTLPQFRELCFGVPALAEVRRELSDRTAERTPFGLLVAQRLDSWAYRQASEDRADRLLRDAYAEAREHVLTGGDLPVVLPALPDDTDRDPVQATPEVASAALAAVREMLDGDPPVHWREDRGRWVATLPTAGGGEARATVTPTGDGGPWRWVVMIAGDVVETGSAPDGEAGKEAAARCAAGVSA